MLMRMLGVCICVLLLCGNASAADNLWTAGSGTSDWFTAGNWSDGVPTNDDKVVIGEGSTPPNPVISASGAVTKYLVIADNTAAGLTIDGGDLTLSWGGLTGPALGVMPKAPGTFNVSGGYVNTGRFFYVGIESTGTLNVTGGTLDVPEALRMAWDGGDGYVNLDGGIIDTGNITWFGGAPAGIAANIDINGGLLLIDGDRTADVSAWITAGQITSDSDLFYGYDFPIFGKTLVCRSSDVPILIPGDANCDTLVNEDDAAILAENWLASGASWSMGDFNNDGKVDDRDATLMATNWGWGSTVESAPEPSTIVLLLGALVAIAILRRK